MKFTAKWRIDGLGGKTTEQGEEVDVKFADVKQHVSPMYGGTAASDSHAVLEPSVVARLRTDYENKLAEAERKLRDELAAQISAEITAK